GWKEPGYVAAGAVVPGNLHVRALVCPFDPLVWERDRTERLFDFRYRIEIYTPAAKRVFGYYVFPFVLGNDIVGRVDLKADRKNNVLLVRGTHVEEGHDESKVAAALSDELDEMARWLDLSSVRVGPRGNLARALRRARR
ncbi:MAG: YcaQ family DNA glycosylase, partial [Dehalococcoidia bacterium]|nr:YcaQ family DNA glycosylase [Dehalococcoidia bacterium]